MTLRKHNTVLAVHLPSKPIPTSDRCGDEQRVGIDSCRTFGSECRLPYIASGKECGSEHCMFASKMPESLMHLKGTCFDWVPDSWCSRQRRCRQKQIIICGATIAAEFPGEVIVAARLVFVSSGLVVQSRWFGLTAETSVLFFKVLKAPELAVLVFGVDSGRQSSVLGEITHSFCSTAHNQI